MCIYIYIYNICYPPDEPTFRSKNADSALGRQDRLCKRRGGELRFALKMQTVRLEKTKTDCANDEEENLRYKFAWTASAFAGKNLHSSLCLWVRGTYN